MNEPEFIIEIFLKPGEMHWGDTDTRVRTILGSCVALCLWHPNLKIGGMCHYLLPSRRVRNSDEPLDGRYGDEAMEMLMKELEKTHTKPKDYQVKMFGGSNMFSEILKDVNINVGEKNIQKADELVKKYGFNVASKDMGGTEHRSILFDIWNGDVWLKKPKKGEI
jgi:chemotaxis protein CheD